MTTPLRSINLDALSLLVRSQRPAVLYELDARSPRLLETLRREGAEWEFLFEFNKEELMRDVDFDTGVRILALCNQLAQVESLGGAQYLIESHYQAVEDDRDHAQAHAEVQALAEHRAGVQERPAPVAQAAPAPAEDDFLAAVGEVGAVNTSRERVLHQNGLLQEELARVREQLAAATTRTRTVRMEEERAEYRSEIKTLREQNKEFQERLRRAGLMPKWEDPKQRKVETADGGTEVSVEAMRRESRWQHPERQLPAQKGVVIPKSSKDSQDIMRVARRIEAFLERCGGNAEQPLLSAALVADGSVITNALRYLEQNGRVTRVGWDVTLVRDKKLG